MHRWKKYPYRKLKRLNNSTCLKCNHPPGMYWLGPHCTQTLHLFNALKVHRQSHPGFWREVSDANTSKFWRHRFLGVVGGLLLSGTDLSNFGREMVSCWSSLLQEKNGKKRRLCVVNSVLDQQKINF